MSRRRVSIDAPTTRDAGGWEIRVSARDDPSSGERIVIVDSVPIDCDGERRESVVTGAGSAC